MCIRIIQTWFIFIIGIFTLQAQGADDEILSRIEAVGFDYITDVHYLEDGSFYCILRYDYGNSDQFINGIALETPSVPEELQFGYDGFSFLIKVNADFEIEKQIYFGGIVFELIYLENEIILKNNWERDGAILINDSLVTISKDDRTRMYRYDYDLNYIGDLKFENIVSNVTQGSEDILYVALTLNEEVPYFVNGLDTIENFYFFNFGDTETKYYSEHSNVLLTYDIQKDSILTARKFGSVGEMPIRHFEVDTEGNLIIAGYISGQGIWISLNGIDTIYTYTTLENTGNEYFNKFDLEGNLIYGRVLPSGATLALDIDIDDNIYLTGRYYADSFAIDGKELSSDYIEGVSGAQSYLAKLDGETGIAQWVLELEGNVNAENFVDIDIRNDTVMVSHRCYIGSIWIDGVEYMTPPDAPSGSPQEQLVSYLWLDADSGNLLDYRVFTDVVRGLHPIDIRQLENGEYDLFIAMRGQNVLFSEDLGTVNNGPSTRSLNMIRISKQGSLVDVIDKIYGSQLSLYPNPATERIYIDERLNGKSYSVYNLSGQLIKKGKVTEAGIVTSSLSSGTYMLSVLGERSQLFVKE